MRKVPTSGRDVYSRFIKIPLGELTVFKATRIYIFQGEMLNK